MKNKLINIINNYNQKLSFEVQDVSSLHNGHGHGFSGESHFNVIIKSDKMTTLEKIKIQKDITIQCSDLFNQNKVHAISIKFSEN